MNEKKEKTSRVALTLWFAIVILCILIVSLGTAFLAVRILAYFDIIVQFSFEGLSDLNTVLIFVSAISLVVGAALAMFVGKIPLRPINRIITQLNRLASGDYAARLNFGNTVEQHPAFKETANSFNKLARELENTEMLRSDFINNFSHEFKTPIMSIAGFARLLKRDNLTDEQRAEYIDIIEEESHRLAYMATNVLNLTKVENQTILTGATTFNISEQIRAAVLLLEGKWSRKNIDFNLDFREYDIEANEEMLKQVWINLIENAIKFSPEGGTVEITVEEIASSIKVRVVNSGFIPKDKLSRIWGKFYQADESHSSEGNGVGLAVVKGIVSLHGGRAIADSKGGKVTVAITLPKKRP